MFINFNKTCKIVVPTFDHAYNLVRTGSYMYLEHKYELR